MTSKEKNRLASIFLLAQGGLQTLVIFGFTLLFSLVASDAPASDKGFFIFFGLFYFIYFLVFIIPQLIGGWKMYKEDPNAKNWGVIASILACFWIPLGTGAGIYALVFLLGDEGKDFYSKFESQSNQTNSSSANQNYLPNVKLNNISDFDKSKNREPYSWMDK